MKHNLREIFLEKKKLGKNQKDAAHHLKISHRAINRIVSNPEHDLKASQINAFAEYLEVNSIDIYKNTTLKSIDCYQDGTDQVHFYDNESEQHFLEIPAGSNSIIKDRSLITMKNLNVNRKWDYGYVLMFKKFRDPREIQNTEIFGLIETEHKIFRLCVIYKLDPQTANNRYNVRYFSSTNIIQQVKVREIAEFVYSANPTLFNYKTITK